MDDESFLHKESNQPAEDRSTSGVGEIPGDSEAGCSDKPLQRITMIQFVGPKEKE